MSAEKLGKESVRVRPMEAEDITGVLEIDRKLSGVQRASTYIKPSDEVLGGEFALSFVAEVGDQCVGFILTRVTRIGAPPVETALIQILGIDPAYQRRGVATALVDSLVTACKSRNLGMVRIMLSGRDSQLHSFFQGMHFRRSEFIEYTRNLKDE